MLGELAEAENGMRQVAIAFVALFLAALGSPQDSTPSKVLIPLIVTDSHKALVSGLKPTSLIVSERKEPVAEIDLLHGLDMPLELGVLIDTSGSERDYGHLNEIVAGAKDFVNHMVRGSEDRIFFLTFAAKTQATEWLKKEQLSGVSLDVKLGGGTALYDSLATACRERMGPRDWNHSTRRVLVIISDGDDNQSHITRDEAVSEALKSGVVIFAADAHLLGNLGKGDRILKYLAEVSGGEFFAGFTPKEIPKVFSRIKEVSEGMYFAKYAPPASNTRVHEVEVKPALTEKLEISYPRKYLWIQ